MSRSVFGAPEAPGRRMMLLAAAAAASLAGCGSAPLRPQDDWADVNLERDPNAPTAIDPAALSRRTRVVVFPTEEPATARGAGLHFTAAAAVEAALAGSGVEVVDRGLASKLDGEIKLAEMRGGTTYNGPDVADYAVKVVMGPASWSSEFVPATSFRGKDGKVTNIPASHTHSGRAVMTIRIYAVPSLRLVRELPAEGQHRVPLQQSAAPPAQGPALMKTATEGGITGQKGSMLNEFAPKGYVVSRRVKGDESLFRVMLGQDTGATKCDKVQIFSLRQNRNPLTNTVSTDEVLQAEGDMTEVIGGNESWVRVKDKKAADTVRMGQIVRVRKAADTKERVFDMVRQLRC